jgi:asparagine synthase (glutamine-hydrolysing)
MCGICGIAGDPRFELLEPMTRALAHRGPDDTGIWTDAAAAVGLGHRRLSIIDLSPAGRQPMTNEDGTVWIVFNGEIYDFEAHRRRLEAGGHRFRSRTDSEVLLHLYEDLGPDFLGAVNGMFALALWDADRRRLLLARDHAGIKPLYYRVDGGALHFASEIKALLRVPGVERAVDHERLPEFLTLLWVPGGNTLLRGIRKVEPGQYVVWQDGRVETRRWFSLAWDPDESLSEADWVERVGQTFLRTTRRQMVSDVPLGAFLSGGADSSSIVACMRRSFPDREIRCYTARLRPGDMTRDQFVDDYPYAVKVAEHLGVSLRSVDLEPDMFRLLPKMVYHLDEPDADPAVFPSYRIAQLARDDGTTVLLSGTGGDEVFFGYRSHQAYDRYRQLDRLPVGLLSPFLRLAEAAGARWMGSQSAVVRRLRKFGAGWQRAGLERHLALVDWSSDATRRGLWSAAMAGALAGRSASDALRGDWDRFEGTGEINRHSHVLLQTFLAAHNFLYTDKSSMAVSLEVRVPFLDLELLRLAVRIPERFKVRRGVTKHVFKRAMEPHLGREILYRSKTGFGVPLRKWMAEDLRPAVGRLLAPERLRARGIFDPDAVARVIAENDANRADHSYLLYCLVCLELWQQTFVDRPGEIVELEELPLPAAVRSRGSPSASP